MNKKLTKGQRVYDKYEVRVQILVNKWEYKFNYGSLTDDDLKEFHKDCEEFCVNSMDVTSNMCDYGLI